MSVSMSMTSRLSVGITALLQLFALVSIAMPYAFSEETSIANQAPAAQKKPRFNLDIDLSGKTNFYEFGSPSHQVGIETLISPRYVIIKDQLSVFALGAFVPGADAYSVYEFDDTQIGLSKTPIVISKVFSIGIRAKTILPTNRTTRLTDSFILGYRLAPRLNVKLDSLKMQWLALFIEVSGGQNIHQYTTKNKTGEANTQWTSSYRLNIDISPLDWASVNFDFIRAVGLTYNGKPRNSFDFVQEIEFTPLPVSFKQFAFAFGHENTADAYKENRIDSNVKVFDGQTSVFYASLRFKI